MLEWLKLDILTHIYIYIYIYTELVSPGGCFKYVYMAISFSILKKKAKNDTIARKMNGVTGLKFSMHTEPNSGSNMG